MCLLPISSAYSAYAVCVVSESDCSLLSNRAQQNAWYSTYAHNKLTIEEDLQLMETAYDVFTKIIKYNSAYSVPLISKCL